MNTPTSIRLTGEAYGDETAEIAWQFETARADGIDVLLSIKMLALELKLRTFFYGYNLKAFVDQTNALNTAGAMRVELINYDETLTCEFIPKDCVTTYLSIDCRALGPDFSDQASRLELQRMTKLVPVGVSGTRFLLCFLKLHASVAEFAARLDGVLEHTGIATRNPYMSEE